MFGKMMNSYYYGKSGKGDFTKEDMPQNRWELFWQTLRVRFSALVRLNLMYVVVWLPAIIVMALGVMAAYSGLATVLDDTAAADAAQAAQTYQQYGDTLRALLFQTLLLLIPCIAITGPATAGVSYVTRNWARDEHAFIWSDFKDALKENWKQALLTSVITGIMPMLIYVCFNFYGEMARQSAFFIVPQVLSVSVAILWLCMLMYIYPLMVTYQLKYRDLLKNALLLSIARLPMTVGLKLLSIVPVAIAALVSYLTPYFQYALLALGLYYVLLGYSLSRFVAASYTNGVFDRFINTKIEGAAVNKGLYVDEDDDEPEEEAAADQPGDE